MPAAYPYWCNRCSEPRIPCFWIALPGLHRIMPTLLDPGSFPAIRGISCRYTSSRWHRRKFTAHPNKPEPDHQACGLERVWLSSQTITRHMQKVGSPVMLELVEECSCSKYRNNCCAFSSALRN